MANLTSSKANLLFVQKCLKLPFFVLGISADEDLRKYDKVFYFAICLDTACLISMAEFLRSSEYKEYNLECLFHAGLTSSFIHFLCILRRKSHHLRQIYDQTTKGPQTSPIFLQNCATDLRRNNLALVRIYGVFLPSLGFCAFLNFIYHFPPEYGSPSSFLFPAKYPWPMNTFGWHCFSLAFHWLQNLPVFCIFVLLQSLIISLRTIIRTHKSLLLRKIRNLDTSDSPEQSNGYGAGSKTGRTASPRENKLSQLHDIIRYHQFFIRLMKHNNEITNALMNFAVIQFTQGCIIALLAILPVTKNVLSITNMKILLCISLFLSIFSISCYFSNELNEMDDEIADTLYNTLWYEQSLEYQRDFLVLQIISANTVKVKMLGIRVVRLDCIVDVLKKVYSTVQVLNKTMK